MGNMLDIKSKALEMIKSNFNCFRNDCNLYLNEVTFKRRDLYSNLDNFLGCINGFHSLGVLSWEDRTYFSDSAMKLYFDTTNVLYKDN